jgi:hypothetical protein
MSKTQKELWQDLSGSSDRSLLNKPNKAELNFDQKIGTLDQCIIVTTDGRTVPVLADLTTRTVFPLRKNKNEAT